MKKSNKKISVAIVLYVFSFHTFSNAQTEEKKLPSVSVKTPKGETLNIQSISNNGKPIIISIWETTCKPCINELDAIQENYADWKKETGVKVVAISIDDTRSSSSAPVLANAKGWDFDIYLDVNKDVKRAMNFSYCPQTYLIDGSGNIVWQSSSYASGDEEQLYSLVQKLSKGEKIEAK
ncbi:MAG: TlpA disulfide reductase family protein [Bacteroidia bacterium]